MKFRVMVKTGSPKGPLVEETDDRVILHFRRPAAKFKINPAVVKLLSWYLGVAKSHIKIKSGYKSSHKKVEIA